MGAKTCMFVYADGNLTYTIERNRRRMVNQAEHMATKADVLGEKLRLTSTAVVVTVNFANSFTS